jgi:ABC-2 type transport system permease protein
MNKIVLIIQREYLSRVRKRSFLIMTFLTPLFFVGVYAGAIWLAINGKKMDDKKVITVVDDSHRFNGKLHDSKIVQFEYSAENLTDVKKKTEGSGVYILYIPSFYSNDVPKGIQLISEKQPGISVVDYIENEINKIIEKEELMANGITEEMLEKLKVKINIETKRLTEKGEETGNTNARSIIGYIAALLIYLFIFLYGMQVMRGVVEEKTNRIVEVIISSVKPFQLMMGKIIGIALVGLTQFLLWIFLTLIIGNFIAVKVVGDNVKKFQEVQQQNNITKKYDGLTTKNELKEDGMNKAIQAVKTINLPLMAGMFIFYFLAGYLLYSALFAAVGSAIDQDSDSQQFTLPVTLPLIFSFIVSTTVVAQSPDGPVAFWLSIIPFTSPVAMMVRIPFGVPAWQIAISMVVLVISFFGTVWVAGRIYRTGILMYGKKVTFRELGKWLFYSK